MVCGCVYRNIKENAELVQTFDAMIFYSHSTKENIYGQGFPFVGNGKIGFVVDHHNPMFSIFYGPSAPDGVQEMWQNVLPYVM